MREKDELFEAVLRVAGWEYKTLTPSARNWINAALKELRSVGATPEEVLIRGRRYWNRYPNLKTRRPSPSTLAKHWAALVEPGPMDAPVRQDCTEHLFTEEDHRGRYCVRCREWIVVQLRLIQDGDIA